MEKESSLIENSKKSIQKNEELKSIFEKIFDYLSTLSSGEERVFFSGEYDSHQTIFERKSNNLEIGVIGNNSKVGLCLLHILRLIIDEHYKTQKRLREMLFSDVKFTNQLSIQMLISKLGKREKQYALNFKSSETFNTTLSKWNRTTEEVEDIIITKTKEEIDIWDFDRIKTKILSVC